MDGANGVIAGAEPDAPTAAASQPQVRLGGVSGLGVFAGVGATVLCLAFSPKVNSSTFTPKFAVLLLFAAVGLVPLARLVRAPTPVRWPARAACAFLAVALVSALASPSPNLGIFGLYLWGTGWLFWLGAAGAFAIGASLGPIDRQWLFAGLLAGAVGNALEAVFQNLVNLPVAGMTLFDGTQADGFLGNPIHLEALMLGALALVLGRTCRSPIRWGAVVVLLAGGLELTFERFALAILAALILYALYSYGARRGGIFALLIAAGYGIAYIAGGSGLGSRVTSGTSETTFGLRLRVWLLGAHYLLHHPLLGAGPGQLRTAMDSTATLSFFQRVLAGRILTDGHDIFVEVAVTTGLLGVACFLVWLFGAARTAKRCCFLGFAASMFAVELVEPLNVAILPLAFLALGAATAVRFSPELSASGAVSQPSDQQSSAIEPANRRVGALSRTTSFVALAVAVSLGATMVIGDFYMFRSENYRPGQPFNLASAKDANRLLPYWPDSALQVAQVEASDSIKGAFVNPSILNESRQSTEAAVNRDSRNPQIWTLLASADVELKSYGAARTDYFRALSCDRWFTQALEGLGQLSAIHRDWAGEVRWYRLALTTASKDADLAASIRLVLRSAERHEKFGSG